MSTDALARARLRVAESVTDLIGDTPLVRLRALETDTPGVEIWGKCEFMNPGGSVKDRPAHQMILDAQRRGGLPEGQTIIDATSGNTGVAYSLIGAALGVPVTLVMPGNVSWARRKIAETFGTHVILSDPMEGSDGAIRACRKLVADEPGRYFYPDQYSNPSNPLAHEGTTGREIWEQTDGRVTHFVAGIGTSGTIMGVGRRLKSYRRDIRVWAVEPDHPLHGLEGLKHMASSLVPAIYHPDELDGVMPMSTEEAWDMCERLGKDEGLLVGHSSGAAAAGAVRLARELARAGKPGVIVTVFADRADRYFGPPGGDSAALARTATPPHPIITEAALAAIYAHARRDYPRECCGVIHGSRSTAVADDARPCRNVQDELHAVDPAGYPRDARTAYNLDTADLFALAKSLRTDRPAKIVYHSHVDSGAYFSDMDQAAAQIDGEPTYPVDHVVIDARRDGPHGAAQFAWDAQARKYVLVRRYASTPDPARGPGAITPIEPSS